MCELWLRVHRISQGFFWWNIKTVVLLTAVACLHITHYLIWIMTTDLYESRFLNGTVIATKHTDDYLCLIKVTRITWLKMFWSEILLLNNQIDMSKQINMHHTKTMVDFLKLILKYTYFFLGSGTFVLMLCFYKVDVYMNFIYLT